jgi:sugar O-acyltransferase (sialic acid O-acetyltransferase NeuD family)
MKLQPLVLLGHGGFGREIAAWIGARQLPFEIVGFLDDTHSDPSVLGPIRGHVPTPGGKEMYLTCFGDGRPRNELRQDFESRGARFATLLFPEVTSTSRLTTKNSIFMGACSISNNVSLGNDVLVQGFAIIGHDSEIGDGCTVGNHAFVGGGARLGRFSTIHPHAVVLPNISIGEGAVVGAGSVAIKDVAPFTSVFGAPAREISRSKHHE